MYAFLSPDWGHGAKLNTPSARANCYWSICILRTVVHCGIHMYERSVCVLEL